VLPTVRPARLQLLAGLVTAGLRPDGYTPAELGNHFHMRKIACQGIEMGDLIVEYTSSIHFALNLEPLD